MNGGGVCMYIWNEYIINIWAYIFYILYMHYNATSLLLERLHSHMQLHFKRRLNYHHQVGRPTDRPTDRKSDGEHNIGWH